MRRDRKGTGKVQKQWKKKKKSREIRGLPFVTGGEGLEDCWGPRFFFLKFGGHQKKKSFGGHQNE